MKKAFSFLFQHQYLGLALAAASIGALAFAYVSQYGFGLEPCVLCLYQRKPFFAVIALGLGAFFLAQKQPKAAFILLLLSGFALTIGAIIAGFHVGVEQKWWPGLQACGGSLPEGASVEELTKYLENRDVVRCDIPAWTLFGISMAGYNFMFSGFLADITFLCALKGYKK